MRNLLSKHLNAVSENSDQLSPTPDIRKELDIVYTPSILSVSGMCGGFPNADDPDSWLSHEGKEYAFEVRAVNNGKSRLNVRIVPNTEDGDCYPHCAYLDNNDYLYTEYGSKEWKSVPPNFSPTFSFTQEPGQSDSQTMHFKFIADNVSPEGAQPFPGTEFFYLNIFASHEDPDDHVHYLGCSPDDTALEGAIGKAMLLIGNVHV